MGGLNGSGSGVVDTVAGGNPTLSVGSGGGNSTYFGVIQNSAGSLALDKVGGGTLVLVGDDTYSGGTAVDAGRLIVASETALPGGSSLVVGAGGTFIFDPSAGSTPVTGGALPNGAGLAAVPEPGSLGLLGLAAMVAAAAACRRKLKTCPARQP